MAIKGGNPLFKVEMSETNEGIAVDMIFPTHGTVHHEFELPDGLDHVVVHGLMLGIKTKAQNHLGAVKAAERSEKAAFERGKALAAAWNEGAWNPGREESDGVAIGGIIAKAVARVLGKDVATIVAHVRGKYAHIQDDKQRAAATKQGWDDLADAKDKKTGEFRFHAAIKAIKAEQDAAREAARLARASKKDHATAESLLAGLE